MLIRICSIYIDKITKTLKTLKIITFLKRVNLTEESEQFTEKSVKFSGKVDFLRNKYAILNKM